jgi:hypothetical protein
MQKNKLPEAFIHYVWQTKSFDQNNLLSTKGQRVQILNFGMINHNSGPDFLHSTISIDGQKWVGNVEMHINANEWYQHGHQNDKAYDTVILHVVLNNNKEIANSSGAVIPTIELSDRIPDHLYQNYLKLSLEKEFIPCQALLASVNPTELILIQERMMMERLSVKAKEIERHFHNTNMDWKETFHIVLLSAMGLNVNKHAFEVLAYNLHFKLLENYSNDADKCAALLFGQAGFLKEGGDKYVSMLHEEYNFLAHKHQLRSLSKDIWRFSRMRPSQFPTIRIAQYCALVCKHPNLLSSILVKPDIKYWRTLIDLEAFDYWNNHYVFNKVSNRNEVKRITNSTKELLFINAILPFIFFYGKKKGSEKLSQYAIEAFRTLKKENNKIIRSWKEIGISIETGFDTQSLLHLYKNYCKKKRCLQCSIGHKILTSKH